MPSTGSVSFFGMREPVQIKHCPRCKRGTVAPVRIGNVLRIICMTCKYIIYTERKRGV